MTLNLRSCFLITVLIPATIFSQSLSRLDGSKISSAQLDNKVQQLIKDGNVQGLAITVFNKNKAVYKKVFGYKRFDTKEPLQTNTNFYGASLSKAVFSVLVMKMVEENVIELDKPLESYLPQPIYAYGKGSSWNQDYTSLQEDSLYKKITARMCLDHSSGFPNWRWYEPDQKLRVLFQPGTGYSYSGEGLCYLQFVLEKITGKSLEQLMEEKIFRPLKMTTSAYYWQPRFEANYCFGHAADNKVYEKDKDNAPRSASTLETTPDDLSLFFAGVLQKKILTPASYEEMFTPQLRLRSKIQMEARSWLDSTNSENDNIQLSYGLGWGILQTPYGFGAFKEGHGDGFQHYAIIFPDKQMGILIMTNSDNGEGIFKQLLEVAIADKYTPWRWQNYIPYDQKK
ncbi:MAG TPA: serine hydrolase domain-containing protein [Chitinophagaceae bacterium]|jgi:CubicO group peptidase (beta-lactamase class C family)|nr:serine hydrolase domain-containing protein [Chitinophagaceae bacterium]